MSSSKDFFLSVTERIFSNWTALKMAVEHGMGSKEEAQYFCLYAVELFYMNNNIISSEVAAELEDYMEEAFKTVLEDLSSTEVAEELMRFYNYFKNEEETTALAEFEKLPPLQSWITTHAPTKPMPSRSSSHENDSSSEDGEDSNDQMEVADDDWTVVRTRGKNRTGKF